MRKTVFEVSIRSLSCVWLFATPRTSARQASLSITNSQKLLKLMSIKLVMPSNHLILCCPLLWPSIFPSIRIFSNESALHIRRQKYWEFQLQHQSFQWIFRTHFLWDWLVGSPCSPRELSRFFSNTAVQKHPFLSAHPSLWSNSHIHTSLLDYTDLCWQSNVSAFLYIF